MFNLGYLKWKSASIYVQFGVTLIMFFGIILLFFYPSYEGLSVTGQVWNQKSKIKIGKTGPQLNFPYLQQWA